MADTIALGMTAAVTIAVASFIAALYEEGWRGFLRGL